MENKRFFVFIKKIEGLTFGIGLVLRHIHQTARAPCLETAPHFIPRIAVLALSVIRDLQG